MMPTLTDSGARLYESIPPGITAADGQQNYALAVLSAGLATMLDPVAAIVRDNPDGSPGFSQLFDVANIAPAWLPWLAQWVGVDLTGITSVAAQRAAIQGHTGFNRGSLAAMTEAAQRTLTGTKTVLLQARPSGAAFKLNAWTLASETADSAATLRALTSQLPAWLVLTYTTITGGTYSVLPSHHATYTLQLGAHATYLDLRNNP